ncbi:MAG: 1-deoxy-D-xylulose-5-phosphate reductoisomerase [Gammaproteobacteria bacterium]|nr:1-deoxy-D-xylulose-5-phosphate reductoisomerase [Gammaproteobacteria bacterium]
MTTVTATAAPQSVAILGATGSIGASALDVIARHPRQYRVAGLSAHANIDALRRQCARFQPDLAVMADAAAARRLADELEGAPTRVLGGGDALAELAAAADIVVCGIVGAAGLASTLAAVRAGKKVLIANKEPLVMLGGLILREARNAGATVLPIDSEHNAIFQCVAAAAGPGDGGDGGGAVPGARPAGLARIILTGSGGPFRRLPLGEFRHVTPAQACAHPNWDMGPKVSVDSATMMNKGLELIEACALFAVGEREVDIVIHPQSVVHSLVEFADRSVLAQLGPPDMRVAIAHALGWPQRIASGARRLSLTDCARLDFEPPDHRRFPCIGLARQAARAGGALPAAMNAANEVAVDAFLRGQLRFDRIAATVESSMARADASDGDCTLEDALDADAQARRQCRELLRAAPVTVGVAAESTASAESTAATPGSPAATPAVC